MPKKLKLTGSMKTYKNFYNSYQKKERCSFHPGDWNAKVGSQEMPEVTRKFGFKVQSEAGQRLTEFCQENALVIANTHFQKHKKSLYILTSPDGQYRNQTDCILCSRIWEALTVSRNKMWS